MCQQEVTMPFYLMRFSYTPDAWAKLIKQPEDRRKVATALIESVGGKLHGFWYGFGEHDGYVLIQSPDNASAGAAPARRRARARLPRRLRRARPPPPPPESPRGGLVGGAFLKRLRGDLGNVV